MNATERMKKILAAPAAALRQIDAILEGRASIGYADDLRTITFQEAADRLNVSRPTIYRIIQSGQLETVLIGGLKRIPVRALTAYATRKVKRGI